MGWKISLVIINKPKQVDNLILLKELGFINVKENGEELFEIARFPKGKSVYIGKYKDNLLICHNDLSTVLIEKDDSNYVRILKTLFPNSELCALDLHSVVNYWGYAIYQNGTKIRARAGSSDDGTFLEIGNPLEEEQNLLSKSILDKEGVRTYILEDFEDEIFTEDQVGENFVFAICKRYFGHELDEAEDLIDNTYLKCFSYSKLMDNDKKLSWWKFW